MSDDNKPKLGMRAPLGLNKAVEVGKVKQSFSHGRTKQVVVEVKRARVLHRPRRNRLQRRRLRLWQHLRRWQRRLPRLSQRRLPGKPSLLPHPWRPSTCLPPSLPRLRRRRVSCRRR